MSWHGSVVFIFLLPLGVGVLYTGVGSGVYNLQYRWLLYVDMRMVSRRLSSLGVYIIVKCIQGAPAPPRATLEAVWFRLRFVVCVLAFPPAL